MNMNLNMNTINLKKFGLTLLTVTGTVLAASSYGGEKAASWLDNTISPVTNPIFFEDPNITTELRPVYFNHRLPGTFEFSGGSVPLGGEIQVMAVQARLALTDKLALIATKDGYIASTPDHTLNHTYGWGDIAAGLKYAVIDNKEKSLIVTPGFTITLPTGNRSVFQGGGDGLWNLFVSAEKGFGDTHITANVGALIPNDFSDQTAQLHYSLQADYYVCQYFIPFVAANAYTVLTTGDQKLLGAVDLNKELNDLSNFGATKAAGSTQFIPGIGFRSRLTHNLDAGFAYEYGLSHPQGIFKDRFTVDLIWRF